jgi:hypothetical protein
MPPDRPTVMLSSSAPSGGARMSMNGNRYDAQFVSEENVGRTLAGTR